MPAVRITLDPHRLPRLMQRAVSTDEYGHFVQPLTAYDLHNAFVAAMWRFYGGGLNFGLVQRVDALLPDNEPKLRGELVGWAPVHASVVEALNWWHAFDDRVKSQWPADWGEDHDWARSAVRWLEREDAVERVADGMVFVQADSRGRPIDLGNAHQIESATTIAREAVWDLRAHGTERVAGTVRGARWIRNAAHHDWAHLVTPRGGASTVPRDQVLMTLEWVSDVESSRPDDSRAAAYQAHFAGELVQRAFWDLAHVGFVAVAMLHGQPAKTAKSG